MPKNNPPMLPVTPLSNPPYVIYFAMTLFFWLVATGRLEAAFKAIWGAKDQVIEAKVNTPPDPPTREI